MRLAAAAAVSCLLISSLSATEYAAAAITQATDIAPQSLGDALETFARDRKLQLIYATDDVGSRHSDGAVGNLSSGDALKRLLKGTGLSYRFLDDKTVTVQPAVGSFRKSETRSDSRNSELDGGSLGDSFRLAQANQGMAQISSAVGGDTRSSSTNAENSSHEQSALGEIVVTAEKREEKLQEVPAGVATITGDRLELLGLTNLTDMSDYLPGVSILSGGSPGFRVINIRGVQEGSGLLAPTVATYIDDLPIGSAGGSPSGGSRASQYGVDLMPYDIASIEVLQGPQGTLYGADAMGGVFKYVLRKPDLTNVDVRVGGDSAYVDGSNQPTWSARGAVNLPIVTDVLGFRISAFHQYNAGYLDNIGTGTDHSNHGTEDGGRASVLWRPNEQLSIQASAIVQDIKSADTSAVDANPATQQPIYGWRLRDTYIPEPFVQQTRFYSLNLDWNFGFATLTSAAGWSHLSSAYTQDLTYDDFSSSLPPGSPANVVTGYYTTSRSSKFVEETRLTSPQNQSIEWMLGAFYTREKPSENAALLPFTLSLAPLPPADNLLTTDVRETYEEWAGFANATYKFNPRFDVSGGLRYARIQQGNCVTTGGIYGSGFNGCPDTPTQHDTTWMTDARFHLDQQAMFYARVATGYRPGGGCPTCGTPSLGIPGSYQSDSLINYEVGFKGEFDRKLQANLSVFYINWKDIQQTQTTPAGFAYTGNGGTAVSEGFELSLIYLITDGLQLATTLDRTNAHLTENAPGIGATNGQPLLGIAPWTASATLDYRRPLGAQFTLITGGSYRYKDEMINGYGSAANVAPIPPHSLVDLYSGVASQNLTTKLYLKNAFNSHSYVGVEFGDGPIDRYVPTQPRTIGISADYHF